MKYSNIPLAQTLVSLCEAYEIKHVVISPGSRNAPLTIGFTHNAYFKCYSIVDERSAAFFAMGIAQQMQHPVALVCTSGSALLNYFPAVAEAFYSNIPLVVLSADRPEKLVGIGDGQTINQQHVYGSHVVYDVNLKLDLKEQKDALLKGTQTFIKSVETKLERLLGLQQEVQSYNETEIKRALKKAIRAKGPVHLNVPFDEPLYETTDTCIIEKTKLIEKSSASKVSSIQVNHFKELWQSTKRKMILVGVLNPNEIEEKWLNEFANDDSVLVFTETTSNLHHKDFFPSIDKIIAPLNENEFKELRPDFLITMGGMIVSKKIKAFLRKHQPQEHWHIGLNGANDTFFCLTEQVQVNPNVFFEKTFPDITHSIKSDYKDNWLTIRGIRRKGHKDYLSRIPFSDLKVFQEILNTIPKHVNVQIGNSSAIRYAQLFEWDKTNHVFCNRGTSGIDGSTSTAIGSAAAINRTTLFITGDLSFFYDSNALWNNYIPKNFKIILINNSGGGIFRILPGHKNTENFDTYFETKHSLKANQLCEMFGFSYLTAENGDELLSELQSLYNCKNGPCLLEIFTPARVNDKILLDYFKNIG